MATAKRIDQCVGFTSKRERCHKPTSGGTNFCHLHKWQLRAFEETGAIPKKKEQSWQEKYPGFLEK